MLEELGASRVEAKRTDLAAHIAEANRVRAAVVVKLPAIPLPSAGAEQPFHPAGPGHGAVGVHRLRLAV
ncbi:hypothetical protein AWC22_14110 [Mycobacterium riyadhense]|uniref:Uncharacterized protein n=1 Tax=Mycobacterium riyadhense TaxID=486698 RepID=A0A1X2D7H6_9MYCO|nr:hypothetical protein AWC22_14110 [Mycobacterium riyadhense]